MAAILFAVRKKDQEKRDAAAKRAKNRTSGDTEFRGSSDTDHPRLSEPVEEDFVPAWAKACKCWHSFWRLTTMDDRFWSLQPEASKFYNGQRVQVSVAVLIFGNFIANVVEKEIDPAGDTHGSTFQVFEYFFNIAFAIELLINMYAHWFWKFWLYPNTWSLNTWNLFDLIVVSVGLLSMSGVLAGSNITMLRTLRAFRVFRLFKRVKALNKILQALVRSVPGVSHAFSVVLLVMSIYAILGVELFREVGVNTQGTLNMTYGSGAEVDITTPRQMHYGDEYFGNFTRALYTLFQILLTDSWSEVLARPLIFGWHPVGGVAYIVSFMLICVVVLTNVVVAVLLEKVIEDPDAGKVEEVLEEDSNGTRDGEAAGDGEGDCGDMPAAAPSAVPSGGVLGKRQSIKPAPKMYKVESVSSTKVAPYEGELPRADTPSDSAQLWEEVRQLRAELGEMRRDVSQVLPALEQLGRQLALLQEHRVRSSVTNAHNATVVAE